MSSKYKTITTPPLVASYLWLAKPDTKYKDPGVYSVTVTIPAERNEAEEEFLKSLLAINDECHKEQVEEYQKALKDLKGQALAKRKAAGPPALYSPLKPVYNDDGEETGAYTLRATMASSYVNKEDGSTVEMKPEVLMADGKTPYEKVPALCAGTIVQLLLVYRGGFRLESMNTAGVAMKLSKVRVNEPVLYTGDNAFGDYEPDANDDDDIAF